MTELERLALTTAFAAAVVVAGLALSLVPQVELVTLVVFCSGVVLGPRGGAMAGGLGMALYHMANSAVRGFPPSLPYLLAQSAGMVLVGLAGGSWRRWWLGAGTPRRSAVWALPVIGALLTGLYHTILNLLSAFLFVEGDVSRRGFFLAGMAMSLANVVSNAVVFAAGAPPSVHALRRLARRRRWWGIVGVSAAIVVFPLGASAAPEAPGDSSAVVAAGDTTSSGQVRPLWVPIEAEEWAERGLPGLPGPALTQGGEVAPMPGSAVPPPMDRWGIGWGRTHVTYDGMPLNGPVHGFAEPLDLPLAWSGAWRERWVATGNTIDLGAAPAPSGKPASRISLTTGSLSRRTAEFALFRGLGPVDLGVDFMDRQEGDNTVHRVVDLSRLWLRLASRGDARWSVDVATGLEKRALYLGGDLGRETRRLQVSWGDTGPRAHTRAALQLRRQALRAHGAAGDFGEILFDGFSLLGEWNTPWGPTGRVRWDRDRRRGGFQAPMSLDGLHATMEGGWENGRWRLGWEGGAGYQEPYHFTWSGAGRAALRGKRWELSAAVSHEEDLPPLVLGLDRPTPEFGIEKQLEVYERVTDPEGRTGARVEASWTPGRVAAQVGGWWVRQTHYRVDSNPLWSTGSLLLPSPYPGPDATVVGAYGRLRAEATPRIFGVGEFRVDSRDRTEVPYLASWILDGAVHWRRVWFHGSIDLDMALGGTVVGPRRTARGVEYVNTPLGYLDIRGQVGNGVLLIALRNLSGGYMESDVVDSDFATPVPVPGRTLLVGLTMYLKD